MILERLIAHALSQRLILVMLTLALVGGGLFAVRQIPIDAFPDVSSTQVKIILKAPGMTPEEVETRVTAPVEQELLGIPNQKILRSVSKYAIADITLDFQDGTDIYWARQQVAERLGNVQKELPDSVSGGLAPITTPLGEMFMFTIEGELSPAQKRTLLDWVIRPRLRTIPGVADVNSLGGLVRSFEVTPDPAALAARRVSLAQLEEALSANNRNDGAGRLSAGEESLLVRSEGSLRTVEDIRAVTIAERGGVAVRVGDVARVGEGALTRYGTVTKDGQAEAVEGLVLGLRGANARQVVEGVRAALTELEPTLPPGVKLVPFYDRGSLVNRAVHTVSKALTEAIVLVLVLLYAFLGNVRSALVVAAILPLSALATFILMRQFGLSANLMSLGGLAIAIGMLVDAAVVIVENIEAHAHLETGAYRRPKLNLIYRAVREVAVPVTAGIAIIVTVFLPLLTLEGLEGKLFIPVALTIVFALLGSLALSLTVIPGLASILLADHTHTEPWLVRKLNAAYLPLLDWSLAHPARVATAAAVALVAAVGSYFLVGKSFMPQLDEGDMILQLEKLPSINLQASAGLDQRLQQAILQKVPDVRSIVARTGSDELGLDPMGLNQTDTFLTLAPREEWKLPSKEAIQDALREVLKDFPGIDYSFTQPIEMRVSEMLVGVRGDLAVKIYGSDLPTLNALAAQMVALLETVPGSQDVLTVKNSGVQYLRVKIDPLAAGRLGLTAAQIESDLRALVEGKVNGLVIEGARRVPLTVRGADGVRNAPALFRQLRLPLADGSSVPLSAVATLEEVDGPVKVDRENGSRMAVVQANVRGRDLVGFVEEAKRKAATELKLPEGYRMTWGGQFENQQRAAQRLSLVVPVAMGLIMVLLYSTLGSFRQAVLVFANIPFALVGGIFALLASGEYLSVPASVGFIALMGIAVLNGLVLVGYFNQLAAAGEPIATVVREGARRRLRPVLMTASITAFGLIPLLLATGPGSEIQRPLAVVVIGGLVSSTVLTLILLPILYRRYGQERTA